MNIPLKLKIIERYGTSARFARAIQEREETVSRLIHGRVKPKPEQVFTYSQALGCKPEELFGE